MSNLTLFDLTYRVARTMGILTEGVASGGSATTIVDNPFRDEADNYWADGSAWIVYDAGGSGASPQGKFARITSSTSSTYTITFPTITDAVASGDRYAVARKFSTNKPWIDVIIQHVNAALRDVGPIPVTDITSITTAADQTEYSLPIAANHGLLEVYIQGDTSDSNANEWIRLMDWDVQVSATGTADLLVFGIQPPSGYKLKLVYNAPHPEMYAATSELSERVPEELVLYPAIRDSFRALKRQTGWDKWDDEIARWERMAEQIKTQRHVYKVRPSPRGMVIGRSVAVEDREFKSTVRL